MWAARSTRDLTHSRVLPCDRTEQKIHFSPLPNLNVHPSPNMMMQTANGFPLLSPQVTLAGLRWTSWTEKCRAADRCVLKMGYTMDIPCISPKIAILIGKMMTQKPMDFRWFWGTPFSKHTQKSPCWLCIQLFPHGFPISIRGPILGLVWGQQLAHPHVSPVHAWRRWLLGWRMWMEMGSGRVWLRLISCHISNMHVYIR